MQTRCKRNVWDLLEEMFMSGCFKMKSYTPKHLGLSPSITPPERMKPVMTYEEAKERVDKLIGLYTDEEHRSYLAEIGTFENHNIVAKCFKLGILPRTAPCLGPQLVLPDGKSFGRRAIDSREPMGSNKRDNVGAMPRPDIVLAMKAKNSLILSTKRQRKKKSPPPELEPRELEPCKVKKKRKHKKAASLPTSPPPEDDCVAVPEKVSRENVRRGTEKRKKVVSPSGDDLTLPGEARQETIGKDISGDLPVAEVPPSTPQVKAAMDSWVQSKLHDFLGNVDDTEVLMESPLISGLRNGLWVGR